MRLKLGYPDKVVEVSGGRVYLFKKKLYSAPLEEVVNYYLKGEGLLAPPLRTVAADVARAILGGGDFGNTLGVWGRVKEGMST
ncbi:MAG: hypothetical protein J7L37_03060 [Thermococcus sp.]|nr:hypothetical protein [Thermococcus sp.]